ncbi:TerB family tellurite resistance protein [Bacteroidales bacterium OttesenSCG-928-B11]|nr:TerB family tellurite resistance protein [Bacteroidales bacterium OttesenSCG-928-E04]MDL2308998.1 TerB family tellurite resistance protein [Bacteroidales bacterium OttesenSCG-928-C03]MDL2312207.1 TerB family tellurite resistance protein [Bacteroidales bacterium OttesenSCG-928-B11]MDL2326860.1 TerB family tellurite resistance protein [Bacteroidales bacterium OttesenSCG-928-A14]
MFTFLGIVIGLISGGFWGGVLGFIIGSFVDGISFKRKVYRRQYHYSQEKFISFLLVLTAAVMKSDGNVRTSELDYVKNYLRKNFSPDTQQRLLLELRNILDKNYSIDVICDDLRANATIHEKLYILQFLFGLAAADGQFSQQELDVIQRISDLSGVNRMDYESIKSMYMYQNFAGGYYQSSQGGYSSGGGSFGGGYGGSSYGGYTTSRESLDNDYKILEINSSATDDEVKKAYRAMAKKYHPDKVNHLGEEIRKDAEEKFARMNQAYERIKKSRGMN